MKKLSGDVIILHMCTKNHKHMIYTSRDMQCNRHNFLSFLGHFLPFYPTIYPKNKIWKKCKNTPGDIILLHICGINEDHMMYGSCNTRHGKQNFLSFWAIFLHLTLLATQKINIFKKMKKKLWRDYHFTLVYHK